MTSAWRARPLSSMPAARLSAATKPGAGRADVERLGVAQAERVRDERRRVRHDLVGGRRGDEDEVDLLERDRRGAVECLPGRRGSARSVSRSSGRA